jgi:hypothetical protein
MKTIFSPVKHSYLAKIGILLIVIALVAGILSCEPGDTYELIMAENPAGGGTATDETGGSPYGVLESVDIKAVAAPCHRFVNWEAPVGIFGNATAAETTFIMPAQDVIVTANFEPIPADHYKFYTVDWDEGLYVGKEVLLVDQFGAFNATVGDPLYLGNPVKKVHNDMVTPISDDNRHFMFYELDYGEEGPMLDSWTVMVNNQFQDDVELTVQGPVALAVPTTKEGHEAPGCLNHYLVYDAYGPLVNDEVFLKDQFTEEWVVVDEAWYFANPVQKTIIESGEVTEIEDRDPHGHLVFYRIEGEPIEKRVQIDNQFGNRTLDLSYPELLAVPSQKISWEQPLNHFKTYWAQWPLEPPPLWEPPLPVDVQLEDQFTADWLGEPLSANVTEPFLFANPTSKEKMVGDEEVEWTPVSDWKDHLTFYWIDYEEEEQMWEVTVDNQFGNNQWLKVIGPLWLAVPTGKLAPDWPADLNHFLVYVVYDYETVPEKFVYLKDQFMGQETVVWEPEFFAVPAKKIHGDVVTDIKDDKHLLFYWLSGGEFTWYNLPVVNQFGQQYLDVAQENDLLGVPSDKIEVSGPFPVPD